MKVTFQFPTHRKSPGHTFLTQQKGLRDPDGFPGGLGMTGDKKKMPEREEGTLRRIEIFKAKATFQEICSWPSHSSTALNTQGIAHVRIQNEWAESAFEVRRRDTKSQNKSWIKDARCIQRKRKKEEIEQRGIDTEAFFCLPEYMKGTLQFYIPLLIP